jgi:hypothetical protein
MNNHITCFIISAEKERLQSNGASCDKNYFSLPLTAVFIINLFVLGPLVYPRNLYDAEVATVTQEIASAVGSTGDRGNCRRVKC